MNGKVHKVRINVKNSMKKNTNKKKVQNVPLKMCTFEGFQRLPADSFNKNDCNALQVQCKVNKNKARTIDKSNPNARMRKERRNMNTRHKSLQDEIISGFDRKTSNIASKHIAITKVQNQNQPHPLSSSTTKRCVVKLRRIRANQKSKDNLLEPLDSNNTRNFPISVEKMDNSEAKNNLLKKSRARKGIGADKYNPNDKYEILQHKAINHLTLKSCNTESNLIGIPKNQKRNQSNSLSSITTKKCVVKLKKIQVNKTTKNILLEPLTLNKTRKFVVRLKKTGNSSISSNLSSQMPIIDNIMRQNLRKLSLSSSYRKFQGNKETKKDHDKEMQEQCNSHKIIEITETSTASNELQEHSQKNTRKHNELTGIKQIAKLSLKRLDISKNKNRTLEDTEFEAEKNSTIYFEPVRNSTLIGFTKSKQENFQTNITTPSKNTPLSRNLANHSDEIENLINSLDEEEIVLNSLQNGNENYCITSENICNKNTETQNHISIANNKSSKFFHRKKNVSENILKCLPAQKTKSPETQKVTKKRRICAKRSTTVKRENVYEFLSQSQTSDSDVAKHVDPSADIIKKLIDQGKVRVATSCKGRGKPKFKPEKKNKTNKKKHIKNKTQKVVKFIEENQNDAVEDQDFVDHFDNDEQSADVCDDMEIQRRNMISNNSNNQNHKNPINEQDGTFSRLARSVLLNQAGRSDLERKNAPLLLKDLNFNSTPKNKRWPSPQTVLETDLSPIALPPPRKASSPWRVNEDAYLPTTFNFSRCSGNLPSFSSDYIPSTPRKQRSKIYLSVPNQTAVTSEKSPTKLKQNDDIENVQLQTSHLNEPSVISSFSSHDSNAENMPPPRHTPENSNENESTFNFKQIPNPRRTLNHRSPLKSINIIEVIHLPPYIHSNKTTTAKQQIEMFGCEKNLIDSCRGKRSATAVSAEQRNDALRDTETSPKDDLFGFEDYLSQPEFLSQEDNESCNNLTANEQNRTIHDRLLDLRKLKPDENEIKTNSGKKIERVTLFGDDATKVDGMRQRGIKEMLCSTMLHPQPSTSKEALKRLKSANLKNSKIPKFGEHLDQSELFNDPEPETTFNENDAHRTYIRPYKRKPRLKESKYIVFLDSDESENEDNSWEQQKRQHSRELNTSSEHAPKKKRHHKDPNEKPELIEFVREFNEMCKDVDSYNLIVEKST